MERRGPVKVNELCGWQHAPYNLDVNITSHPLITEYQSRMHVNGDSNMCCVCYYWVTGADDSGSSGSTKGAVIENNMYWENTE